MNPNKILESEKKNKMDRQKDLDSMREKLKQLRKQQNKTYDTSKILNNIDIFWKGKINEEIQEQVSKGPKPSNRHPTLTMTKVISIADIPPTKKEEKQKVITYSHGSQTKSMDDIMAEMKPEILPPTEDENETTKDEVKGEIKQEQKEEPNVQVEKPKKVIVNEKNLASFLDRSSKIVMKAMSYPDPFVDYFQGGHGKHDDQMFQLAGQFQCDETHKRSTLCLDFSPHHPELFLAGYSTPQSTKEALVIVWSIYDTKEPQKILRYNQAEDITSAVFYKYMPNIILGGTSKGKLLQWDLKGKSEPVAISPTTKYIHTHAIGTIAVLGTENVHDIYTMSTSGLVRVFKSIQFKDIIQHLHFHNKNSDVQNRQHPITAQVSTFSDLNRFFIGSESGTLYSTQRYGEHVGEYDIYEKGHYSMITGLHMHPKHNDLLLSCSLDWKVCLWRINQQDAPIATFIGSQHVMHDVAWHPHYPSVFATVDGSGNVSLWHIDVSPDAPLEIFPVTSVSNAGLLASQSSNNLSPLFALRWSQNGEHLLVGGEKGLHRLTLDKTVIPSPQSATWINSGLNAAGGSDSLGIADTSLTMMNPEIQYHLANF